VDLVIDSDLFIRQGVNGVDLVITTTKAGNQSLRFSGNPMKNRQDLASRLGLTLDNFVYMGAEMKDHVVFVTSSDRGRGSASQAESIACDAMFTNEPGVFPVLLPGDCATVFVVHELVWGIIHAGRDNAAIIIPKAIGLICTAFNIDPRSIFAVVGPTIGNSLDEERLTRDADLRYFFSREKEKYIHKQRVEKTWIRSGAIVDTVIDVEGIGVEGWEVLLAKYVEFALRESGVIRILNPNLDTMSGKFFSHSLSVKTGTEEGRHACLIGRF
jgi:copper oxidase (laccase) domain-containing protein